MKYFLLLLLSIFAIASEDAKMEKIKGPQPLDLKVSFEVRDKEDTILKAGTQKVEFLLGHDQLDFKSYIWNFKIDKELDYSVNLVSKKDGEDSMLWRLEGHLFQKHDGRRFPVCGFQQISKDLPGYQILKDPVEDNCYHISGKKILRYTTTYTIQKSK